MSKHIEVEELDKLVQQEIDDCKKDLARGDDVLTRGLTYTMAGANRVVTIAKNMPSIEIIRCKDCKHNVINHGRYCTFGDCSGCLVADDFFCKNGERKDTE